MTVAVWAVRTGWPALTTALPSVSATRAVMPIATTAMAAASATETILRWVVRSAPIREWFMAQVLASVPRTSEAPAVRHGAETFFGLSEGLGGRTDRREGPGLQPVQMEPDMGGFRGG